MILEKIVKFAITGGLGTITNLLLFFIFADLLHFNFNVVSLFAFFVACTQNYILNHVWTFKGKSGSKLRLTLWVKFMLGSVLGFGLNLLVLNLLLKVYPSWKFYVIPQGVGTLAGVSVNFLISNFFVFKYKNN